MGEFFEAVLLVKKPFRLKGFCLSGATTFLEGVGIAQATGIFLGRARQTLKKEPALWGFFDDFYPGLTGFPLKENPFFRE